MSSYWPEEDEVAAIDLLDVDKLLEEVAEYKGCKVQYITDPLAKIFIERVKQLKQAGKNPNIERTSEILLEKWGIDIPRRALSEHTRGKCSCQRLKK